jgi:hypothetical protein
MVMRLVQPWYEAGSTSGPYQAGSSMRLVYITSCLYQASTGTRVVLAYVIPVCLVGSLIAGPGSGLIPWLSDTCLDFLHIHPNCSQWCKFLCFLSTL